jgi:hypothetical protein
MLGRGLQCKAVGVFFLDQAFHTSAEYISAVLPKYAPQHSANVACLGGCPFSTSLLSVQTSLLD